MGIFNLFRGPDINQGLKEFRSAANAVLLDVRTPQEYREGHLPGNLNVPLQTIGDTACVVSEKAAPIFVYCHSGARSGQAASVLAQMGYSNVKNIGGIVSYTGKVVR
ncbi:MAG: rhodanese-like domain-containing protein [Clostridiales bacterium]|nr:rhodanese-like domain-containing protein [Clostridiales bacterium]